MASRTLPNIGLKGFWTLGEDGWKDENDLNLLKLSVLVQGGAISKVSATPGSPVDGDVYLFDETHPTDANKIAIRDSGAWVFLTPLEGWLMHNQAAGYYEKFDGTAWAELATGGSGGAVTESIIIACSDEVTALTAGTNKVTFRMPYAFTLTAVYASLTTAQTSGAIFTVDINEAGASILSTKLTIDNGEDDSATAAAPAVLSDTSLAARAKITIDIDQVGDGTAKGLKVTLVGHQ